MKTSSKINHGISYLAVFMGVVVIVSGVAIFYSGQHNIDLGYNAKNLGLVDTASDGNTYTTDNLYAYGLTQINNALWIVMVGVFTGTTGLVSLSNMVGRKDL